MELVALRDWLVQRLELYVTPFWKDGKLAITDGRMMVVFDCDAPEDTFTYRLFVDGKWTGEGRKPPDIDALMACIGNYSDVVMPNVEGPPVAVDAMWETEVVCDECMGDGQCECDMGHMHDCNDCNGSGKVRDVCDEALERIELSGHFFGRRYLWLLSQLPGLRLCESSNQDMLTARFDYGCAFLMSMAQQ